MRKNQITKRLESIGAAWAVKDEKYIGTNDPGDPWKLKPTWHIHPDCTYPHINNIARFESLRDLSEWITTIERSVKNSS